MKDLHRAYGKLRSIVERHGGSMTYEREGRPRYGVWVITLGAETKIVPATGEKSFPELDKFYVPKIVEPKTWDDRHDRLLDDAEEVFLKWLNSSREAA